MVICLWCSTSTGNLPKYKYVYSYLQVFSPVCTLQVQITKTHSSSTEFNASSHKQNVIIFWHLICCSRKVLIQKINTLKFVATSL